MGKLAIKQDIYAIAPESLAIDPSAESRPRTALGLVLTACLGLWLLAAFLLVQNAILAAPMPDELHWVNRAGTVLKRARENSWMHLTSALPHPGIPGSLAMAVGQYVAPKWNSVVGQIPGDAWYLDPLASSRIAAIALAAFMPVVIFLCLGALWSTRVGFWTAVLFALDPYFIAISGQAHIDSSLSLMMISSALIFLLAAERNSSLLHVLSASLWGLAMASKPTAILLLPAYGAMRVLRRILGYADRWLYIRDLWFFVGGLSVFALVYTRLWHRWVKHQFELNIFKGNDIFLDHWAKALVPYRGLVVFIALTIVVAVSIWELRARWRPVVLRLIVHGTVVISLLSLVLVYNVEILRNYLGYFSWVLGLSKTKHVAYGRVWEAPPEGYLGFIVAKLPEAILLSAVLALVVFSYRAIKRTAPKETLRVGCALVVIAAVVGGLSVSGKQGYRYLLPILPLLYLLAVLAYDTLSRSVASSHRKTVFYLGMGILTVTQGVTLYRWHADLHVYHNSIGGGLEGGLRTGSAHAFVRQNEIVDYLQRIAAVEGRTIKVGVIGDYQTLRAAYIRRYPAETRTDGSSLHFNTWFFYDPGEYVVVYPSLLRRMGKDALDIEQQEPVHAERAQGQTLVAIYRPLAPRPQKPIAFSASRLPRRTGKPERLAEGNDVLRAEPAKHKRDYLFYNSYIFVTPGTYRVRLETLGMPQETALAAERGVLRVELGSRCQKLVTVGELQQDAEQSFSCTFEKPVYVQLRAYWFGLAPVAVSRVSVETSGSVEGNGAE